MIRYTGRIAVKQPSAAPGTLVDTGERKGWL